MVVTVLGLAELVEEEDHGLKAQDQHDAADEAGGVERVLVRLGGGGDCRGAGVGGSCGEKAQKVIRTRRLCIEAWSQGLRSTPDVGAEAVEELL